MYSIQALQNEGMEGLWGGVYGASASLVSNVSRGALQSVIGFRLLASVFGVSDECVWA